MWTVCEFHGSNYNGFGDIWWTDKLSYFSKLSISLDFRTIKNEANASETNEEKEDETFWSHHQTQQPGKDHHPRDHCREERQRETGKNLGERHRGMGGDKHW